MAVTLKIKRRASSGNPGSPATLSSGELAFNENTTDKLLYYGYGDDGAGNATSVIAIGGAAIPNSGLENSSVTINSNAVALGAALTLDSDDVGEGSTNLYYTNARSRAALSASGGISYNSSSGAFTLGSIPNAALANSFVTVNGGTVNLGGTLTIEGTSNEVDVATSGTTVTVGLPNDVTIANDLTVSGDLTVNGTLTSISTSEVRVEDRNILLGDTSTPTDTTADTGGITLAGATNKTIQWLQATSSWTFNQSINIVNSGTFQVGGTQVLSASRVLSNVAITGSGNTIDNVVLDAGTF